MNLAVAHKRRGHRRMYADVAAPVAATIILMLVLIPLPGERPAPAEPKNAPDDDYAYWRMLLQHHHEVLPLEQQATLTGQDQPQDLHVHDRPHRRKPQRESGPPPPPHVHHASRGHHSQSHVASDQVDASAERRSMLSASGDSGLRQSVALTATDEGCIAPAAPPVSTDVRRQGTRPAAPELIREADPAGPLKRHARVRRREVSKSTRLQTPLEPSESPGRRRVVSKATG